MEASTVPKIMIVSNVYLQQFNFQIKHILQSQNWSADWMSREIEVTHISGILSDMQTYKSESEDICV